MTHTSVTTEAIQRVRSQIWLKSRRDSGTEPRPALLELFAELHAEAAGETP